MLKYLFRNISTIKFCLIFFKKNRFHKQYNWANSERDNPNLLEFQIPNYVDT